MLEKAVSDYLLWMVSRGYAHTTWTHYERVLNHFLSYINEKNIPQDDLFTLDTLKTFQKESELTHVSAPVKGLSSYLFRLNKIPGPIKRQREQLPHLLEEYLLYYERDRQVQLRQVAQARRTLSALDNYLEERKIELASLKIEQVDDFLAGYGKTFAPSTRRVIRTCIRGFLAYLHLQKGILRRNLAPLVVGATQFAEAKPPKFLRPFEVSRLIKSLKLSSNKELRLNAMLRLACSLGLRPKEISSLTLDDIFFKSGEIAIKNRKSLNPIMLPLPEETIKAIAAYVIGARPKSELRFLFLNLKAPYEMIKPAVVSLNIAEAMKKAGLKSSAYWLRHTYAQNLLESGAAIHEVKKMLGHDSIETTKHYIHIQIEMMREVILDETI